MTDDDADLRQALRDYATPGAVPPGGTGRVLAVLDRRRRRRAVLASAAAALVLVGGIGVTAGLARGGPERSAPAEVSDAATDPVVNPAQPCPDRLPMADRATYGFGTEAPATRDPDLPRPVEAWVCSYWPVDTQPGDETFYRWERRGDPAPVQDLRRLEVLLAQVRAPDREPTGDGPALTGVCKADLGSRLLVSMRVAEGGLVGLTLDTFGCEDVRLTPDPSLEAAGGGGVDGLVPGVLDAPAGLLAFAEMTLADEFSTH